MIKVNWILAILKLIWANVSPQIRDAIVKFVEDLEKKANETPNAWDNLAVAVLKVILGID